MIHLHTLGDTLITVGEKEVRPSTPMVFAALLYLGVERGRRVPRAALRELLFPESDERCGSHSVRQLLYKLRQLGAVVSADAHSLGLHTDVMDDMSESSLLAASVAALRGGFVPSYDPQISPAFATWLDSCRDYQIGRIVRALVKRMRSEYDANRLDDALATCSAVLHHDPLNEEATLIHAKTLAVSGQRQKAVELLSDYAADVGQEVRLPAEALNRRIRARTSRPDTEPLLVGRNHDVAAILAHHALAVSSLPAISIVWGEPGIGKSRLAQEVADRVLLEGTQVVWAHCQQRTIGHPLESVTDLAQNLLNCPGSLGVAPESMQWLQRLVGHGRRTSDEEGEWSSADASWYVRLAIQDLISSVAAEAPLMLIVEDVHWIDEASRELLLRQLPKTTRVHVLMTSRTATSAREIPSEADAVCVRKLDALSTSDSTRLFDVLLQNAPGIAGDVRDTCIELANGNPLFIRTLAQHLFSAGGLPASDAGIGDLMLQRIQMLDASSLLLLRMISIFGNLSTSERLRSCVPLNADVFLLALQDLAQHGFVVNKGGRTTCVHQILADTTIRSTPEPLRAELYVRAASRLETEGQIGREASLLWACAEFWHSGGQADRATAALRECAAYAAELGQPKYVIPALERAREFCGHAALPDIVEATVRMADLATDDEGVLRNVEFCRRGFAPGILPTKAVRFFELAEVRALRRLGKDIWPRKDTLLRDALATELPLKDRRRAARTYFVAAEESFAGAEAIEHLRALSHLWEDDTSLDAIELHMLVCMILGDVREAVPLARALVARIDEFPFLARPLSLSAVARTLFAAGLTEESLAVSQQELALAQRVGTASEIAMATARLSDSYLTLGDLASAREWITATRHYAAETPFARVYHLYNSVMLAIADRDFEFAKRELDALRAHDEAQKKHAQRGILGLALLIENATGNLVNASFDEDELRHVDDRAGRHSEHLIFAVGFFLLLMDRGFTTEARERVRTYFRERRREFYDPWPILSLSHLNQAQRREIQIALSDAASTPAHIAVAS